MSLKGEILKEFGLHQHRPQLCQTVGLSTHKLCPNAIRIARPPGLHICTSSFLQPVVPCFHVVAESSAIVAHHKMLLDVVPSLFPSIRSVPSTFRVFPQKEEALLHRLGGPSMTSTQQDRASKGLACGKLRGTALMEVWVKGTGMESEEYQGNVGSLSSLRHSNLKNIRKRIRGLAAQ